MWLCVHAPCVCVGPGGVHRGFRSPSGGTLTPPCPKAHRSSQPVLRVLVWPGHSCSRSAGLLQLHGSPRTCSEAGGEDARGWLAWTPVPLVILLSVPCPAHGLWCQDCTLTTNSSHCTPKQCPPADTVCASVRITDPSSSKSGSSLGWGGVGAVIRVPLASDESMGLGAGHCPAV